MVVIGVRAPRIRSARRCLRAKNPGVKLINASGRGRRRERPVALAERLAANNPPDLWRSLTGAAVDSWAAARRIVSIESVFTATGIGPELPDAIRASLMRDGKPWRCPPVPTAATTCGSTATFSPKPASHLRARLHPGPASGRPGEGRRRGHHGTVPRSRRCVHPSRAVREHAARVVGADGLEADRRRPVRLGRARRVKALDYFGSYIAQTDPAAGQTRWNDAVRKLARGECGYLTMNDSALRRTGRRGAVDGQQFGCTVPRDRGQLPGDRRHLRRCKAGAHGVNALKFLEPSPTRQPCSRSRRSGLGSGAPRRQRRDPLGLSARGVGRTLARHRPAVDGPRG